MPRPRFYKLPPERQHGILVAAGKAIGAGGYEGASLNRILEAAGLSKGAAYYYFDSKDDLVATVFVSLWDRLMATQAPDPNTLVAENFWESIAEFARNFYRSMDEEPWMASAIKAIWGLPAGARSGGPLAEIFKPVEAWFSSYLRRGRELGQVRDDLPEGLLLAMVMAMDEAADRWMIEHWNTLDPALVSQYSDAMLEMFRRVLAPKRMHDV